MDGSIIDAAVGIGGGSVIAIAAEFFRVVFRLMDRGQQMERERFDRAGKALKMADESAAQAAADERRDPGAKSRRFFQFAFVFYLIVGLFIAGMTGKSMAFERDVEMPSTWWGLSEGYTSTVWDVVHGAFAFPLVITRSIIIMLGFYFGFGSVSRVLRRY